VFPKAEKAEKAETQKKQKKQTNCRESSICLLFGNQGNVKQKPKADKLPKKKHMSAFWKSR
jgi:hypothetical protein